MDEIVVGAEGQPVQLTAAGLPRKKPGRKPGTTVKPKATTTTAAVAATEAGQDAPKQRKPRKPRDPNAPPAQRKRKSAPNVEANVGADSKSLASGASNPNSTPAVTPPAAAPRQSKITDLVSTVPVEPRTPTQQDFPVKALKREPHVSSVQNILNAADVPVRTSGQNYDPIRGNYDPVRETMITRDPYGTNSISSPRVPITQVPSRASASPSISILVDPMPSHNPISPPQLSRQSSQQPVIPLRPTQEPTSVPPSPTPQLPRSNVPETIKSTNTHPTEPKKATPTVSTESKKIAATHSAPARATKSESRTKDGPTANGSGHTSKRPSPKQKANTAASSPKTNNLEDPIGGTEPSRSILDFGKAKPGEEFQAPTIVLEISIAPGETNKYVNFMRMAEERYGWDALHPRLAANRDRKARIAAAASALEKSGSGRESGDEMSEDVSDGEGASADHAGGAASGVDVPAKPAKKKRNFKEDEYDRDDDFVDDSELLWQEQAAASRDGFFVYSGPLIQEVEKPAAS